MDEERLEGASTLSPNLLTQEVHIVLKLIVAFFWDNKCINFFPTADQLMIISPAYCIVLSLRDSCLVDYVVSVTVSCWISQVGKNYLYFIKISSKF